MTVWVEGQALADWRKKAQAEAIAAQIAPEEVDWLLQHCTDLDKLSLRLGTFASQDRIACTYSLTALSQIWQKRCLERCPIQYLVGAAPWRHFLLQVSPSVLIPRPETELLIDLVLAQVRHYPALATGNWVDLGTGSGAIALGLAAVLPQTSIHAVDQSADALAIAVSNAQKYDLADRIQFYQGSWWQPLTTLRGKIAGMVSNPPYIPSSDLPGLQPEVAHHEPRLALDGGEDGLTAIRYLINTAPAYLQSQGLWLIEMMAGQAPQVETLLKAQGSYDAIQIFKDLAGIERFALALRR
ncbi:MAG: peptide chain release factor N(5)-glutamine methyltransferase [Woronichinia naegeliana WA131]|jgi:release factor glutamine methyltransferase|uniref:Release factor glutamine methyltransferase n=1 Tax=Woronichinia naegeliana WA131 TaxID=2824559 RepID=A0A977PVB6_9CYAN|nr:MAG: peptide chain release factor N(5)-glutamine methyltransferase [Woronichinia naegeliana WA131]